jgi:hypothetical protein
MALRALSGPRNKDSSVIPEAAAKNPALRSFRRSRLSCPLTLGFDGAGGQHQAGNEQHNAETAAGAGHDMTITKPKERVNLFL